MNKFLSDRLREYFSPEAHDFGEDFPSNLCVEIVENFLLRIIALEREKKQVHTTFLISRYYNLCKLECLKIIDLKRRLLSQIEELPSKIATVKKNITQLQKEIASLKRENQNYSGLCIIKPNSNTKLHELMM